MQLKQIRTLINVLSQIDTSSFDTEISEKLISNMDALKSVLAEKETSLDSLVQPYVNKEYSPSTDSYDKRYTDTAKAVDLINKFNGADYKVKLAVLSKDEVSKVLTILSPAYKNVITLLQ